MEKTERPEHLEGEQRSADVITSDHEHPGGTYIGEGPGTITMTVDNADVLDEGRNRRLNRLLDVRIIPLCCWLYQLNFLDRGNIGNAKVLNQETHDDLLDRTGMTASGYAITVTLFSVAYAVFEVPSNWVMKHYVRPSLWLALLLGCWVGQMEWLGGQ